MFYFISYDAITIPFTHGAPQKWAIFVTQTHIALHTFNLFYQRRTDVILLTEDPKSHLIIHFTHTSINIALHICSTMPRGRILSATQSTISDTPIFSHEHKNIPAYLYHYAAWPLISQTNTNIFLPHGRPS